MAERAPPRTVYGLHAVRRVIARRPDAIESAKVLDSAVSKSLAKLAHELERRGVRVERVPRSWLDRLCGGGRHQGVALQVRAAPDFELVDFEELVMQRGTALKLLVLDQVQDPRNLGACLRTADAAGVDAVVTARAHSAKLTPAAVKAAAGAAELVPLLRAPNLARSLSWLEEAGVRIVGTDSEAERSLYETELHPPIAVVLGGEGQGLRRLTREHCDELVRVPMHGDVGSLNVSVAAGVVLFELERQRAVRSA